MKTLVELIKQRSIQKEKGIVFCNSGKEDNFISYCKLYIDSLKLLTKLQGMGIKKGNFLIIQTKSTTEFVLLFWASILGGIIPVPLTYAKSDQMILKLKNVAGTLDNYYIIGDSKLKEMIIKNNYNELIDHYYILNIKDILCIESPSTIICDQKEENLAFIQFSSGSTGKPKGVLLTHKNILTNTKAMGVSLNIVKSDQVISWLPLTHDMGLIGAHLNTIFWDINLVLIDTMDFLFKPSIYLDKITSYQPTLSVIPNFGLDFIINYYEKKNSKVKFNWDLSSLRHLLCGAEPISIRAVKKFENILSAFGLKSKVILPVYGLAEGTLAVTFTDINEKYKYIPFDRNSMKIGDRAKIEDTDNQVFFISEGKPVQNVELCIMDEQENQLPQGHIGIIYIKGASITQGYINNPEETELLFTKDGWLNTNDIGAIIDDELYVIGRKKEVIFLNGQNYYASDLEHLIRDKNGCECAIIGENNIEKGKDVVYIFTILKNRSVNKMELSEQITSIIKRHIGIPVEKVVFVSNFPRTTSGKIRRYLLLKEARMKGLL